MPVGIVVVLGAVIATFALGLGENVQYPPPDCVDVELIQNPDGRFLGKRISPV